MIQEDNKVNIDFINALSKSRTKRKSVIKLNNPITPIREEMETPIIKPVSTETDQVSTENTPGEKPQHSAFENIFSTFNKDRTDKLDKEDDNAKKEILYHLLRDYKEDNRGQWTMDTPLYELKYELKKRKNEETELDNIAFIKQILIVVLHLVEFLNSKLGILNLDGWASHVCQNLDDYKRSLRAIHLQYFRSRVSNPISELGWMIAGSMIMFHFSQAPPTSTSGATKPKGKSKIDIGSVMNLVSRIM